MNSFAESTKCGSELISRKMRKKETPHDSGGAVL